MQFWVQGIPATFATKGEAPWKGLLTEFISKPNDDYFDGLKLDFYLPTFTPNNKPLDIDNLCEPVFSVLINKLGWFNGKRSNLKWWLAKKHQGYPNGVRIDLKSKKPNNLCELGAPLFDEIYNGEFPKKATDPVLSDWLCKRINNSDILKNNYYGIRLQYEGLKPNLGDIATGKTKPIIDSLYPILGGYNGSPEDWRIKMLHVEKGVQSSCSNSVRINKHGGV